MNRDLYSDLFSEVARLDDGHALTTLGYTTPLEDEPLHFDIEASLAFPEGVAASRQGEYDRPMLGTAIFGLFGPIGALPYVYSEELARADRSRLEAMRAFFNLLNHRSVSLMYRAWRKSRLCLEHQPGAPDEQQDKATKMFQGFCGLTAMPSRVAWLDLDRSKVLSAANTMQRRVRNANGLKQMLRRHFGMDFRIEEFVGIWEQLPEEARSRFGAKESPMQLGLNTIIGSTTWQVQSTFSVVINHPNSEQYRQLRPDSETLRRVQLMIRMYCTPELTFRLRIVVAGSSITPGRMGDSAENGVMLGWNTVVGMPNPNRDYNFSICKDYNESRMSL